MLMSWRKAIPILAVMVGVNAAAQAQTDVAASLYGAFNESTSGNSIAQGPSNAAGALLEVRHIKNPIVGYEATYAFNRANQKYTQINFNCPVGVVPVCAAPVASVSANAHEVTGDWLVSLKVANLKPFALAGAGVLFDTPQSAAESFVTTVETSTSTKAVFVYGAGLDWTLLPHMGLRFQYRGNLYKAPALVNAFSSTGAFTHTAEPTIGAFFRF